jgi:hypothetical protein
MAIVRTGYCNRRFLRSKCVTTDRGGIGAQQIDPHRGVEHSTRGSVRGRIEEFVEVSTRRLVLAALKHKIAGEFVEGCEQSRAAIGCLGDKHDRIAEALYIDAITSNAILLRKRHKHLCICDNVPKFARILQQ